MTEASGHATAPSQAPSDHGDVHDAHEAHEGQEPPGPIDTQAWLAGIVGVAIGLLMALCFVLATGGMGAY